MNKYDTLDYILLGVAVTTKFFVLAVTFPFWLPLYLIGRIVAKFNLEKFLDDNGF